MSKKQTKNNKFENLTWDDVEVWDGNKILSRGKNYQKSGYVKELVQTSDGDLLAWVDGTERYATRVAFKKGKLSSECSCPYWAVCKHAVAVTLEYLESVRQGKKIGKAPKDDPRLGMFDESEKAKPSAERSPKKGSDDASLKAFLKNKTKAQLTDMVMELAQRHASVREDLRDRLQLADGSVNSMVKAIRKDIHYLGQEPVMYDYWHDEHDEADGPDFSRIEERLESLLSGGYYDEVISLGKDLLEAGTEQVEMYHDDGFVSEQIAECMAVVFRALPGTSLEPAEQMAWAVDVELADQYDLCTGTRHFWEEPHEAATWSSLADILLRRLKSGKPRKGKTDFSDNYKRDRLTNWIIDALKEAGRKDEVLSLCREETEITGSYVRLVNYLLEARQIKEAEEWIERGISATENKRLGIAGQLRGKLEELRKSQGDWPGVAAMNAEKFFQNPSLHNWKQLEQTAKKAGAWKTVRAFALTYLETGRRPGSRTKWPLPKAELKLPEKGFRLSFPDVSALIQIAIDEKNSDEVLKWYEKRKILRGKHLRITYHDDTIAEALKQKYPKQSLEIWKRIAESHIAQVKPSAYRSAATYLRKIRQLLKNQGKEKKWLEYLSELRQTHLRKKRLIEILDRLSGKRIIDG